MSWREGEDCGETLSSALKWAVGALEGSETARLDAQLLLGNVLGQERAWVLAHGEEPLDAGQMRRFQGLVERRARREPVAYLRGFVHWRDLELRVGPGVLVPRPETELLVDEAVAVAKAHGIRTIADVGTGSGAIAIALARVLPEARIIAVERSDGALRAAAENIEGYGLEKRIDLRSGDLLEPVESEPDMVVANLPYLSRGRMETLPQDVRFEPMEALHGGESGLDLYERLLCALRERGWRPELLFEIDPEQEQAMERLLQEYGAEGTVRFVRDLSGRVRIVVCEWGGARR